MLFRSCISHTITSIYKSFSNSTVCPECGNSNRKGLIYACDSMAYAYAYNSIVDMLKEKGKEIHFHEGHPKHQKEQMNNLMRGND